MNRNSNRKPGALSQMGRSPAEFHFRLGCIAFWNLFFAFSVGHLEKTWNANSYRMERPRAVNFHRLLYTKTPTWWWRDRATTTSGFWFGGATWGKMSDHLTSNILGNATSEFREIFRYCSIWHPPTYVSRLKVEFLVNRLQLTNVAYAVRWSITAHTNCAALFRTKVPPTGNMPHNRYFFYHIVTKITQLYCRQTFSIIITQWPLHNYDVIWPRPLPVSGLEVPPWAKWAKHLTSNIYGTLRRNFANFSDIVAFGTHPPFIVRD